MAVYVLRSQIKVFKNIMATFDGNDFIFFNIGTKGFFYSFTFAVYLILYHMLLGFSTCSKKSLDNCLAFQAK